MTGSETFRPTHVSAFRRVRSLLACLVALAIGPTALLGCGSSHDTRAPRADRHPPVVFISFDEFSTTSLVGPDGRIDAGRYPNFAALVRDGDWFPYATAPADETPRAMGALLTGDLPRRGVKPTYGQMPRNLFTLLGKRYRVDSSEEVTSLCPRRLCPHVRAQNQQSVLSELARGRPERFERWTRSIRATGKPQLFFKHVLMPHAPWRYLPSGQQYIRGSEPVPGWGHAFSSRWVSTQKYQRHLLQLAYVDRLVGSVIKRLKSQGLYDRAVVIVTADNGESFGRVDNGHEISRTNFGDLALTPLFIKRSHQQHGATVQRHVRTEDVVPTVALLTHLKMFPHASGHPIYGAGARRIPSRTVVYQRSGHRYTLTAAGLRRWARGARQLKQDLFGSGTSRPGLYGVGPYRRVVGTPVSQWKPEPADVARATLDGREAYASVRPGSAFIPAYVSGRLIGVGRRPPEAVAIALNGQIAATSPTFQTVRNGAFYYAALVEPGALSVGANKVQLFAISGSSASPRLQGL